MTGSQRPLAYLREVAPDAETERKLRAFAADTPIGLLSQIKASRQDMERYLGADITARVVSRLEQMVGSPVSAPPLPARSLGVPLAPPPRTLAEPRYDVERRNRLWQELQRLRQGHAPREDIERIEREFNDLVSSH